MFLTCVRAANYLRMGEWSTNPELMRMIIVFYKKALAMESLARFYESCAQVEVDDYHNFEKALGALKEPLLFLNRSKGPDKPKLIAALEAKMGLVEQYIQARKLFKASQEDQGITVCQGLVNSTADNPDSIVRIGDVYSLLVDYFHAKGDMQQAHALIEQMHSRKIDVLQFIQEALVQQVYSAVGATMDHIVSRNSGQDEEPGKAPLTTPEATPGATETVHEEIEVGAAEDGDEGGGGAGSDVEEDIHEGDT